MQAEHTRTIYATQHMLIKRVAGVYSVVASGTSFTMTSGDTITCVIKSDGAQPAGQRLLVRHSGTTYLTNDNIDAHWSAGKSGLIALSGRNANSDFDNFKVGYDNNADDDIADAGDDIQIDDAFGGTTVTLTYDDNGNLTDDGLFKFVYDAWNRLVKATRRVDAETTVAAYAYYGDNRRSEKIVSNSGTEEVASDGGDTTVRFYYGGTGLPPLNGVVGVGSRWNIVETRDGSNQTTMQMLWGTRYTDELVWLEVNGDVTIGNDVNPDNEATGEDVESPADHRYFVHQDRNWNVTALTDYGAGVHGNIVERYDYTPFGQFVVLKGESSGNELGNVTPTSAVGNVFAHQGLAMDHATGSYQNRWRSRYGERFIQRDPLFRGAFASERILFGNPDIQALNLYMLQRPLTYTDPTGLICCKPCNGGPPGAVPTTLCTMRIRNKKANGGTWGICPCGGMLRCACGFPKTGSCVNVWVCICSARAGGGFNCSWGAGYTVRCP